MLGTEKVYGQSKQPLDEARYKIFSIVSKFIKGEKKELATDEELGNLPVDHDQEASSCCGQSIGKYRKILLTVGVGTFVALTVATIKYFCREETDARNLYCFGDCRKAKRCYEPILTEVAAMHSKGFCYTGSPENTDLKTACEYCSREIDNENDDMNVIMNDPNTPKHLQVIYDAKMEGGKCECDKELSDRLEACEKFVAKFREQVKEKSDCKDKMIDANLKGQRLVLLNAHT